MYLTRTWAYSIHRQKRDMLGKWPENGASTRTNYDTYMTITYNDTVADLNTDILTDNNQHTNDSLVSGLHTSLSELPKAGIPAALPMSLELPNVVLSNYLNKHVHYLDQSPTVVPRPPAFIGSANEVSRMGPGQGGGQAVPGGHLSGGGGHQLPVSLSLTVISALPTVVQTVLGTARSSDSQGCVV